MEDQVYDGIDDYLRYVRRWVKRYDTPLTANSIKEYGSAVWNKWLARRYGREVVRSAWSRAVHTKPGGSRSPPTTRRSRPPAARTSAATSPASPRDLPEWRTDTVFSEGSSYPDVSRQGSLPVGGQVRRRQLNHTTFQLLRVHARRRARARRRGDGAAGHRRRAGAGGQVGSERHGRVVRVLASLGAAAG